MLKLNLDMIAKLFGEDVKDRQKAARFFLQEGAKIPAVITALVGALAE